VPPSKSKNTQHTDKEEGIDWDKRVRFVVKQPVPQKLHVVGEDTKNKRFKIQKRGHPVQYFPYINDEEKEEARVEAEAFRF
jgi:hypothetical protein